MCVMSVTYWKFRSSTNIYPADGRVQRDESCGGKRKLRGGHGDNLHYEEKCPVLDELAARATSI